MTVIGISGEGTGGETGGMRLCAYDRTAAVNRCAIQDVQVGRSRSPGWDAWQVAGVLGESLQQRHEPGAVLRVEPDEQLVVLLVGDALALGSRLRAASVR